MTLDISKYSTDGLWRLNRSQLRDEEDGSVDEASEQTPTYD